MSDLPSAPLLVYAALVFGLAGWIKGVVGMGLPIVSMAALSLVMPPVQAAAWLSLPSLVTNVWQGTTGPALRPLSVRLAPLLALAVLGIGLGVPLLAADNSQVPPLLLGLVLMLYALMALLMKPFTVAPSRQRWAGPVVGGMTGVLAGATGINAVPLVPYLSSLGLSKDEMVQALGLCFSVTTVALAAALAWHGSFPAALALASALAVVPALAGMWLGQRTRSEFSGQAFRRWFLLAMMVMGLYMALRAVWRML